MRYLKKHSQQQQQQVQQHDYHDDNSTNNDNDKSDDDYDEDEDDSYNRNQIRKYGRNDKIMIPIHISPTEWLLRFAVVYGLSGAMRDILNGKYDNNNSNTDTTVNNDSNKIISNMNLLHDAGRCYNQYFRGSLFGLQIVVCNNRMVVAKSTIRKIKPAVGDILIRVNDYRVPLGCPLDELTRYMKTLLKRDGTVRLTFLEWEDEIKGKELTYLEGYRDRKKVTIDTLLPVIDEYEQDSDLPKKPLFVPVYMIGALLGHTHIVRAAFRELNATVHSEIYERRDPDVETYESRSLPCVNILLFWLITSNRPQMIRCLCVECGFQFRLLSDDDYEQIWEALMYHLNHFIGSGIYNKRFIEKDYDDIDDDEEEEKLMWSSSRVHRWDCLRANRLWKNKERMLQVLIESGLPRKLFVLREDLDFTLQKRLFEKYKGIDEKNIPKSELEAFKNNERSRPRVENKFRVRLNKACSEYNDVQPTPTASPIEEDSDYDDDDDDSRVHTNNNKSKNLKKAEEDNNTLHLPYFYERLLDMWKDQKCVQEMKLDEYDPYDPRWVAETTAK